MERRIDAPVADMREIRQVLSRIEARVEGIDARLRAVETNAADIAAKFGRLPTVGVFVTTIVALALTAAGVAIAFAHPAAPP